MLQKIKNHYIHLLISLACLAVFLYFGILIYKEVKPKTYLEKYAHCLELGSNLRSQLCLKQLDSNK